MSIYNLTVYSLANNRCTCYMWHKGTAGRGSSDIASCMLKYLTSQKPEIENVVLFSDTCSGQNCNQFFCSMAVYALSLKEMNINHCLNLCLWRHRLRHSRAPGNPGNEISWFPIPGNKKLPRNANPTCDHLKNYTSLQLQPADFCT